MMLVKRQGGCNGQKILSSFVVVSGRMASVASLVPVHVGINLEPGTFGAVYFRTWWPLGMPVKLAHRIG